MKTRRVDPDDLARLGMDTPNNPMVVTAVVRLDGPIAADALLELVESRVLVHERMRARIESAGLLPRAPRWREVDARARDYVTPVTLAPSPASDADLADLVSDLTARPLDPGRAPWHLWHVDGGGVSALVLRVHHAVADGLALLALLFAFSDEGAAAAVMPDLSAAPRAGHASRSLAASIAELVLAPSDPPSAVSGKLSGRKRLAWTEASDVATLRDAAHAASARINDVLLAVLAGVLHDLPGPRAEGTLHALVPVALGRRDHGLGNDYVSLFVPLPVDVASPVDRVRAARDAMREARAKDGVELGRHLVAGASFAGKHVEQLGVRLFSRKASVVATNLTGPPAPLHMGGRLITDVAFAAPVPGSIALSVNAFSYAGKLRVTIATDAAVVPDPRPIAALFEDRMREAIAALLHHAPAQT